MLGKSTLLAALRGKLPLLSGKRIENDNLRLGVFTQDLAQELDVSARAMDLVTEYARGGKDGDINISNQDARGVMGRLGLGGEKPLRKVGELSGGEWCLLLTDNFWHLSYMILCVFAHAVFLKAKRPEWRCQCLL